MRVRTFGLGRKFQTRSWKKKNHAKLRKGNNYGFFLGGGGIKKDVEPGKLFILKEREVGGLSNPRKWDF